MCIQIVLLHLPEHFSYLNTLSVSMIIESRRILLHKKELLRMKVFGVEPEALK